MDKMIILGNYKPSGYMCGNIYDKRGIAPTFMENHGERICITVDDEGMSDEEIREAIKEFIKVRNG